jgi:glycerophosphoryl diester phosphodiesterase
MFNRSQLIAHRGEMLRFAENTLPAIKCAIDAGARNIEFDIQFSKDQVPVVLHDFTLKRTTGINGVVGDFSLHELKQLAILRNPNSHSSQPATAIPSLREIVGLLNNSSSITAFVEIKAQSMMRFGRGNCIDKVIMTLTKACFPWILISFDKEALSYAMRNYRLSTGWILRHHTRYSRKAAHKLRPEFLFCNVKKLPLRGDPFWIGPWRWVVYDIKEPTQARSLLQRGADMIETGAIVDMLGSPLFNKDDDGSI